MVWMLHMKTNEAVSYCLSRERKATSRSFPSKHFDLSFRIIRGIKLTKQSVYLQLSLHIKEQVFYHWKVNNLKSITWAQQQHEPIEQKIKSQENSVWGLTQNKVKLTVTAPLKIREWEGTGEEWDHQFKSNWHSVSLKREVKKCVFLDLTLLANLKEILNLCLTLCSVVYFIL